MSRLQPLHNGLQDLAAIIVIVVAIYGISLYSRVNSAINNKAKTARELITPFLPEAPRLVQSYDYEQGQHPIRSLGNDGFDVIDHSRGW